MGEGIERRQVPETDPQYLETRRESAKGTRQEIWGEDAVRIYEQSEQLYQMTIKTCELLREQLATTPQAERARIVQKIDEYAQLAQTQKEKRADELRADFKDAALNISHFIILGRDDEKKRFIFDTVYDMFLLAHGTSSFISAREEKGAVLQFVQDMVDGSLDDEVMYTLAVEHAKHMREKEAQLREYVVQVKRGFRERVAAEVRTGFLPASVLADLERIEATDVYIVDTLLNPQSPRCGSMTQDGVMHIVDVLLEPNQGARLRHLVMHEFLHELSGTSITLTHKIGEVEIERPVFFHRKSGVALTQLGSPQRNTWLNEAITEWLALRLSGFSDETGQNSYKGSPVYTDERRELDRLFAAGLEASLVVNAYFEKIENSQPKGEKGKHFRDLVSTINKLGSEHEFARIENKFILSTIGSSLYTYGFHPLSHLDRSEIGDDVVPVIVEVQVGIHEATRAKAEFVIVLIKDEPSTPVEDQWQDMLQLLSDILGKYGPQKVSISGIRDDTGPFSVTAEEEAS